jgi:hypothetical protein
MGRVRIHEFAYWVSGGKAGFGPQQNRPIEQLISREPIGCEQFRYRVGNPRLMYKDFPGLRLEGQEP